MSLKFKIVGRYDCYEFYLRECRKLGFTDRIKIRSVRYTEWRNPRSCDTSTTNCQDC